MIRLSLLLNRCQCRLAISPNALSLYILIVSVQILQSIIGNPSGLALVETRINLIKVPFSKKPQTIINVCACEVVLFHHLTKRESLNAALHKIGLSLSFFFKNFENPNRYLFCGGGHDT